MQSEIRREIVRAGELMARMAADAALQQAVARAAEACVAALRADRKILFMGNGGSAADCQHLAGELVSRFAFDRPGLTAFALTVDTSVLTAIGNDYGYERLFARQVQAVAKRGDVLFALSTSGRSPNILAGVETARAMGVTTVGMTGDRGEAIVGATDICIEIPSPETPRIQEGHIVVGHILCGLIESALFERAR